MASAIGFGLDADSTCKGPPLPRRTGSSTPCQLDTPIDLRHRLVAPCWSSASLAKFSRSFLWPLAHTMTLMLEPPPRTFPMFMGIARPFKLGLGCALKSQSRSEPRFSGHFAGVIGSATASLPPASISSTRTLAFSARRTPYSYSLALHADNRCPFKCQVWHHLLLSVSGRSRTEA
jgi:hypothetical protein